MLHAWAMDLSWDTNEVEENWKTKEPCNPTGWICAFMKWKLQGELTLMELSQNPLGDKVNAEDNKRQREKKGKGS